MNRRDFYLAQKVTEAEIDDAFLQVEEAEKAIKTDMFAGANGFLAANVTVVQEGAGTQRVDVGTGLGWDKDGFRVSNPNASQFVDFTGDDDPADPRIVAVYLGFDRALSDPRLDGLGATVNHKVDESFTFNKVLGTPAPSPTPPAADPSQGLLIAHVTVPAAAGVILDANIDTTVQNLKSSFPVERLSNAGVTALGVNSAIKIVRGPVAGTQIEVERAEVSDTTNTKMLSVANAVIDATGVGAGGIDAGALAASTMYFIYVIGDSSGVNPDDVLLSLLSGPPYAAAPALPAGYDLFRRIGAVPTDGAAAMFNIRKINGVTLFEDGSLTTVFTGAIGSIVFAPISLGAFVPALVAERAILAIHGDTAVSSPGIVEFRSGTTLGPATWTVSTRQGAGGGAGNTFFSHDHIELELSATATVDFRETALGHTTAAVVYVRGFIDDLHYF
jgi:hypothetical protein